MDDLHALDPDALERTLRSQYDHQVRLLFSLDLLEEGSGEQFITVDGRSHLLPRFEEILARLRTPRVQDKLRQGFDTLLLVPFGLPLGRFLDAWRQGLRRNADTLRAIGAFDADPLWVWDGYEADDLVYDPRSFQADHGGRTKAALLTAKDSYWEVLLVEGALQNLPLAGEGETVCGRPQFECGESPAQYVLALHSRTESCLPPEAYVMHFLGTLIHRGEVLDTQTVSYLPRAFLPLSAVVPEARWAPALGRMLLDRGAPDHRFPNFGVRAAVRVA